MNNPLHAYRTTMASAVVVQTTFAMLAFAANSLLCRFALRHTATDPASFTFLRLCSGAVVLAVLLGLRQPRKRLAGGWAGAVALFVYALAFSLGYVQLDTGTGALILFGAVQSSMLLYGLLRGERLRPLAMLGLALALGGLVVLLLPGASAPPLRSALLMLASGVAWGVYSLLGKSASDPLAATAGNFVRAVPLMLLALLPFSATLHIDTPGALSALASGALASGVGYAIWYSALRSLGSMQAATVQLSVPVLAALAGIVLLGEALTLRLVLVAVAVLGGIALVLRQRG